MIQQVTMKSTKASLTETIQYLCRGKVLASETRELASVSRGKIRPGEGEEWLNEQMYVPPLPPTNLRGCHLINVLYHVYVSKSAVIIIIIITRSITNASHSSCTSILSTKKKTHLRKWLSFLRFFFFFSIFYFSVMKALLVTLKRDTSKIINLTFEIFLWIFISNEILLELFICICI